MVLGPSLMYCHSSSTKALNLSIPSALTRILILALKLLTLDRLYNFLEIDDIRLDSDTKINVTEKTESLDDECCRLVANHYTSVYKFIDDRYPIEGKWHSLIYL